MSGIQGKNTHPELVVRKGLHARGIRFRLHVSNLPGKPDIVLPKFRTVVFVNGCFWHAHRGCHLFKLPSSRIEFWQNKFERNVQNDERAVNALANSGWRIAVVWECAVKNQKAEPMRCVLDKLSEWIKSGTLSSSIEFTHQGGPFPLGHN